MWVVALGLRNLYRYIYVHRDLFFPNRICSYRQISSNQVNKIFKFNSHDR